VFLLKKQNTVILNPIQLTIVSWIGFKYNLTTIINANKNSSTSKKKETKRSPALLATFLS